MFTLTAPNQTFTAETLDELEQQLMLSQSFGTYPLWNFEEDDEWGDEWRRFDGALWTGKGDPKSTVEDILDFAAWSLDVPREDITLVED